MTGKRPRKTDDFLRVGTSIVRDRGHEVVAMDLPFDGGNRDD